MSRIDLVLHAPSQADDHWYPAEKTSSGLLFRWSSHARLLWQPGAANQDGFDIIIPFLGAVAADFAEQSFLLVNGVPVQSSIGHKNGFVGVMAEVSDRYVQDVVLVTPDPHSPPNSADPRQLGLAVLVSYPVVQEEVREMPKPAIVEGVAPKVVLIGNCQVQTHAVLVEHMLGAAPFAVADLSNPETRGFEFKQDFAAKLAEADFILAQPNQYLSPSEMPAPGKKNIYTIGGFYFRGLYPDVCYVGDIDHRLDAPSPYHSLVILDAFHRGLNEADCEASFTLDNFTRLGLLDAWKSSQDELTHRDYALDFPIAQLVANAIQNYPAFHSINHPTLTLCYEYLGAVFEFLGVKQRPPAFSTVPDPLLTHNTCMIHDEWAEHLQLPYRTTTRQRFARLHGRFLSRTEMIGHYYEEYRKLDPAHLVVNSPGDMVLALRGNPELKHLTEKA